MTNPKDQPVDELTNTLLEKYGAAAVADTITIFPAQLKSYIQAECNRARLSESEMFMHDMQKAADSIPPNLLLNYAVDRHYDRIAELQQIMKGEEK